MVHASRDTDIVLHLTLDLVTRRRSERPQIGPRSRFFASDRVAGPVCPPLVGWGATAAELAHVGCHGWWALHISVEL